MKANHRRVTRGLIDWRSIVVVGVPDIELELNIPYRCREGAPTAGSEALVSGAGTVSSPLGDLRR